jgi:alpha-tubulin suppressor-like RCC1 family protein
LWAWGFNADGEVGDGTTIARLAPKQIGTATNWKVVASGANSFHTAAVKTDGTLWAWGDNAFGSLGDGTFTRRLAPIRIGSSNWDTVSVGDYHTVALSGSHLLWAWGNNGRGRLGDGTTIGKPSPQLIGVIGDWNQISAGGSGTVALRD